MPKKTQNAVYNTDGSRYRLTESGDSVKDFLAKFNALPCEPRSGYDKYWNDDGFVNPRSPKGLSPQGIGKLMAVLIEKGHEIIVRGGNDAVEMTGIFAGLKAYEAIAATEVAKQAEQTAMEQALKVVSPEKLAQFLAGKGLTNLPAPQPIQEAVVTPTEATAAAANEAVETAIENAVDAVENATETEPTPAAQTEEQPVEETLEA